MRIDDRRSNTIITDSDIAEVGVIAGFAYVTIYSGYTVVLSQSEVEKISRKVEEAEKRLTNP